MNVSSSSDNAKDVIVQEQFEFSSNDIRYRSQQKPVMKETALSVFIFSPCPHTSDVAKFINDINSLRISTSYAAAGVCDELVRMDYVFTEDLFLKLFRNRVEAIEKPQELIWEMKSVSEDQLLHREEPVLEEKEILSIFGDSSLANNIFRGFNVRMLESSSGLQFKFDSMMALNTFLAREVGVEDSFLGKLRGKDLNYQLDFLKKYRKKLIYPLRVKLETCCFGWEETKKLYKFTDSKNKKSKTDQFATIDFTDRKDLFHFVANEPVGFFFKFKK